MKNNSLTNLEKETIILWNEAEDSIRVDTFNQKLINRLHSLTWLEPNSLSSMNFCVLCRASARNIRILLRQISPKSIKNSFDDRCEAVLSEQIFVPKRQRPQVIY